MDSNGPSDRSTFPIVPPPPHGFSDIPTGKAPEEHAMTAADAAFLSRATADKIKREATHQGVQFGTVAAVSAVEGIVPYAEVAVDGDPHGQTITVPVITGNIVYPGLRVALMWDNPSGCYVWGSPSSAQVPCGRISMACGGGGGGG